MAARAKYKALPLISFINIAIVNATVLQSLKRIPWDLIEGKPLSLPKFSGEKVKLLEGWIKQKMTYFIIIGIHKEEQRVVMVGLY